LSLDEEREIARLYADTGTSTSVIRGQFGIGESSLYRIVQRQGIPLRGRTASPKAASTGRARAATTERAPAASAERARPAGTRRNAASTSGGTPRRRAAAQPRTPRAESAASQPATAARRFRIRYRAERVFEAQTIQAALRQAEQLGATEITGVVREDR
jgi:hypothetical protein